MKYMSPWSYPGCSWHMSILSTPISCDLLCQENRTVPISPIVSRSEDFRLKESITLGLTGQRAGKPLGCLVEPIVMQLLATKLFHQLIISGSYSRNTRIIFLFRRL
jgi:hypothetical protein